MVKEDQRIELTRDELYELVWAEPMTKVARRYGLSDRGLAKICDRMGIPVPGRGYWAKVQSGKVPPQVKLPKIRAGQQSSVVLDVNAQELEESKEYQSVADEIEYEMQVENQVVVLEELVEPHPLVEKTTKSLRGAGANDYGIVRPRAKHCLDVRVGKESIDRASRIMDALIKALDDRDIELMFDDEDRQTARIVVDGETLGFSLEEKTHRERYQPTRAEQKELEKNPYYRYRLPDDTFFPSGNLSLKLDIGWWGRGFRGTWSDGKKQRVEGCLNKFIIAAYKAAAAKKADRIERERQKLEWQEQERRREILRQQIEREQERLDALNAQAKAWYEAQQLRAYVQAVRSAGYYPQHSITGGQAIDEWCAWALEQASRLDPTVSSLPSVLDYKKQFYWYR
jgi:hypothetical protein